MILRKRKWLHVPPKPKVQREHIVDAAVSVAREKGIEAVTAREVARALSVSTRPIFSWFDTMEQLKAEVFEQAKARYREYMERGLAQSIPFQGVWQQYLRFATEEPALYRLLFLTPPGDTSGGAMASLSFSQEMVRESIMRVYHMDAHTADCYFRDIWLVAFSFATLIVTDNCPYTIDEMIAVGTEVSLSICKAYKEIPGLPDGRFDRDALFSRLVAQ